MRSKTCLGCGASKIFRACAAQPRDPLVRCWHGAPDQGRRAAGQWRRADTSVEESIFFFCVVVVVVVVVAVVVVVLVLIVVVVLVLIVVVIVVLVVVVVVVLRLESNR